MDSIRFWINNKEVRAQTDQTILEAADRVGIVIPRLCYHPVVKASGSCRLCAVEIEGYRGLPAACSTPPAKGMRVYTATAKVEEFRREILRLILQDHPRECLGCPRDGTCELQQLVAAIGIDFPYTAASDRKPPLKLGGAYFEQDYALCVRCGRCVRVCHEVREHLYKEARRKGILFIRFDLERKPRVRLNGDRIEVSVLDPILRRDILLEADILILASAIVARDTEELAQMFKVPRNPEGFFLEAHMKLRPVDFATDGVYVAGLVHWPKPTEECIAQAKAAASRASTVLAKDSIMAGGVAAVINKDMCSGCQACLECCPFGAISYFEQEARCDVNQALCKGCGTCAATCPSEAICLLGFSHEQLYTQIDEALA